MEGKLTGKSAMIARPTATAGGARSSSGEVARSLPSGEGRDIPAATPRVSAGQSGDLGNQGTAVSSLKTVDDRGSGKAVLSPGSSRLDDRQAAGSIAGSSLGSPVLEGRLAADSTARSSSTSVGFDGRLTADGMAASSPGSAGFDDRRAVEGLARSSPGFTGLDGRHTSGISELLRASIAASTRESLTPVAAAYPPGSAAATVPSTLASTVITSCGTAGAALTVTVNDTMPYTRCSIMTTAITRPIPSIASTTIAGYGQPVAAPYSQLPSGYQAVGAPATSTHMYAPAVGYASQQQGVAGGLGQPRGSYPYQPAMAGMGAYGVPPVPPPMQPPWQQGGGERGTSPAGTPAGYPYGVSNSLGIRDPSLCGAGRTVSARVLARIWVSVPAFEPVSVGTASALSAGTSSFTGSGGDSTRGERCSRCYFC